MMKRIMLFLAKHRLLKLNGATSMELVIAATSKMTAIDTASVLAKTNLAKAQKIQILMDKGLTKAEAEAAILTALSSLGKGGCVK